MSDVEKLQDRVRELRDERASIEAEKTKGDLVREVDGWITIGKSLSAGASRLVLGGRADGDHLMRVLAEDALADEGLAERLLGRLEAEGFGRLTDRQKQQRLDKADAAIKRAEVELREARRAEAIADLEAQFALEEQSAA